MIEEFGSRSYFQAADYAVCGLMLAASLAIGVYYGLRGGGQKTSAAYILADRSMGAFPVTLSLLASFFSGIGLQGVPADVYYHGPGIILSLLPFWLGGALTFAFFLPLFYRLGAASAYEYLEHRFNRAVKICGVTSYLFFTVFYSGLVTFMGCVAANAVTGIGLSSAIVILSVVCSIYTVIGGIKAVLWTDSLQMVLMVSTTLAIVIKCVMELGLGRLWSIAREGQRTSLNIFTTDMSEFYNGWSFILNTFFLGIVFTNQYMVQRLVVCKSQATARRSLLGYLIGASIFKCLLILVGISLYAYYEGCDPTIIGYTTKNDQILPYFIVDAFSYSPGLPGLLLTGLFGAALSTSSSILNAIATLIGEHFVKPYWKGLSDTKYTVILKLIVVAASAVSLGIAFLVPTIGDAVPVITLFSGCTTGSLVALYVLGAFVPFCGSKGALVGFGVAMGWAVVMSVGCIIFHDRPVNLPLSADVCLNDTYALTNGTATTVATYTTMAQWHVTGATATAAVDVGSSGFTAVFSLAKSWLGLFTFLGTVLVALFTTVVTGWNDTSNMDPRLVIWKIKSSYICEDDIKPVSPEGKGYTAIEQTEDNGDAKPKCEPRIPVEVVSAV